MKSELEQIIDDIKFELLTSKIALIIMTIFTLITTALLVVTIINKDIVAMIISIVAILGFIVSIILLYKAIVNNNISLWYYNKQLINELAEDLK